MKERVMKMKKILIFLIITSLTLGMIGCGTTDTEPMSDENNEVSETDDENVTIEGPVKVGLFGPLSGSMSIAGTRQKEGAEYAAKKINDTGGVLGAEIEIINEDTEGVPQNAVNIYNKF